MPVVAFGDNQICAEEHSFSSGPQPQLLCKARREKSSVSLREGNAVHFNERVRSLSEMIPDTSSVPETCSHIYYYVSWGPEKMRGDAANFWGLQIEKKKKANWFQKALFLPALPFTICGNMFLPCPLLLPRSDLEKLQKLS